MAFEARLRLAARIDDELTAAAAGLHVQASRPVTGLTAGVLFAGHPFEMQPGVRTGSKGAGKIAMTFYARLVAYKCRTFDLRRRQHGALDTGTGSQNEDGHPKASRYH